ncbi:MAG: zinc-binding dehydrogenase, partial [Candidatus Bathyarchaeota archaeon]
EIVNAREENTIAKVKQLTDGCGADVVIEAVGLPTTWEQAMKMVRKGGIVLEFGGCPPGTKVQMDTELLHYNEVTVKGSFHATPTHFRKALNLIASGVLNMEPVISKKMPLSQLHEAFERLATTRSEVKIAIIP